jgi:hypothetical protein
MLTDEQVRTKFRQMLDEDPACPLTPRARVEGSSDLATAWFMAGILHSKIVNEGECSSIEQDIRVVRREFTARGRRPRS